MGRKRWFKIILRYALAGSGLLTIMEGCATYFLHHPDKAPSSLLPSMRYYYVMEDRQIIQYNADATQYDKELFYRLRSGTFTFENREFSTQYSVNSKGFRDDEDALDHPQIIVLGDSYAMGWGVEQAETFASRIENSTGLKTLNASTSSYGTAREIMALEDLALDSVQCIVIQYCENDHTENLGMIHNKGVLPISSAAEYRSICTDYRARRSYFPLKHSAALFRIWRNPHREIMHRASWTKWEDPSRPEAFLKVLEMSHLPTVPIVVLELSPKMRDGSFIRAVQAAVAENQSTFHKRLFCLDLHSKIKSKHRYVLDEHLNASGHTLVARELEAVLKKILKN